jgi:hypothetical protein
MKKNNTCEQSRKLRPRVGRQAAITSGKDQDDKVSRNCVLDDDGEKVREGSVATTRKALAQKFGVARCSRIVLEVGTHSP